MSRAPVAGTSISDYVAMILRWRKTAGLVVGGVLLVTAVVTLLSHKVYTARVTLLPEAPSLDSGGLTSMLADKIGLLPGLMGGSTSTPGDIAVSLLQSKAVAGDVVDSVGLIAAWKLDKEAPDAQREIAIDRLQKSMRVIQDDRTMVKLSVQDTDPVRVAKIANGFLDALDRANNNFSTGSAGRTRRFVEGRLNETRVELSAAQDSLKEFQRKYGALAMDEQTKTTVEVIAKLQGEVEAMKAKRDALGFSMNENSSEMRGLSAQIAAMEARVKGLVSPGSSAAGRNGVLLSLGSVPDLAAEYGRLYLAVQTQITVYGLLAAQYEQAKIEEARTAPSVRVLDRATPPLYPTRPRKILNMGVGFVLGCSLAFLLVLLLDHLAPAGENEGDRWRRLVRRSPFPRAA